MVTERRRLGLGRADLVLLGERQPGDVLEIAHGGRIVETRLPELALVEGRVLEQVADLSAIAVPVQPELLVEGSRLCRLIEHHGRSALLP